MRLRLGLQLRLGSGLRKRIRRFALMFWWSEIILTPPSPADNLEQVTHLLLNLVGVRHCVSDFLAQQLAIPLP